VTALRARIHELEEINSRNEAKARKHVRNEFNNSIRKLFGLSFEQKSRIDEYRNQLHAITLQRIAEVRDEASTEMSRIKERGGVRASAVLSLAVDKSSGEDIHVSQLANPSFKVAPAGSLISPDLMYPCSILMQAFQHQLS
ncbi:unnamed protein product, partial [Trichobilharzia regenti]